MCADISKKIIEKWRDEQIRLSLKIRHLPLKIKSGLIAGIDVSYKDTYIYCSIVVLSFPKLEVVNIYNKKGEVEYPYIPGFLSFREMPVVLRTFNRVKEDIFLIFCDGQGIAHPRGFGLASHIGTVLRIPSIGCAKSRLVGEYRPVAKKKGNFSELIYKNKVVGAVLITKDNTNPVFVSAGNYIDLESAIRYTLDCSVYRIPEPTRLAHKYVTSFRESR